MKLKKNIQKYTEMKGEKQDGTIEFDGVKPAV